MIISSRFDILPSQDKELLVWGKTFLANLTPPAWGVLDETVNDLRTKLNEIDELIQKSVDLQNTAKHISSLKKTKRQLLDKQFREEIRRIKARADYTPSAGLLMGIEAPSKSANLTDMVPQLSIVDRTGGVVEISFPKYGSDGLNFYSQRDGDTDWVLLSYANRSPYKDQRPLLITGHAELRRYSAVYVKRGQEVSGFSPEFLIACAP